MLNKENIDFNFWHQEAIDLLSKLISISSFSKEEEGTADAIFQYLEKHGAQPNRNKNNVFAVNKNFDKSKPSIVLNSHHDTVKPNPKYTRDPFMPAIEDGKLYGLGSNDAGGPLVSLINTFLILKEEENLQYNIILAATAEEEISGKNGIEDLINQSKEIFPLYTNEKNFAIIGEPTMMDLAIAERGLMVIDCTCHGIAGHAAREEGESALLKAVNDIQCIAHHQFEKVSDLLGKTKVSATVINTENNAHNVVPTTCDYVLDCRVNELYTFEEVVVLLKNIVDGKTDLKPRSMRLKSSLISLDHPIVKSGLNMQKKYYGSPTTSDKALINIPALKMGPGDSARSHSADEYIWIDEIKNGIEGYIDILLPVIYN